jgi:hypothetical protein
MKWWIEKSFIIWPGNDNAMSSSRQHDKAMEQVKVLYALEDEVTVEDRNIFEMDISKRLQYPTKILKYGQTI